MIRKVDLEAASMDITKLRRVLCNSFVFLVLCPALFQLLPSSSKQSKRQLVGNEDDVHELQKTVEEMRIELESEREERARPSEQQKADKVAFEAQLAKVMAILKGQERVPRSPSPSMSRSPSPST